MKSFLEDFSDKDLDGINTPNLQQFVSFERYLRNTHKTWEDRRNPPEIGYSLRCEYCLLESFLEDVLHPDNLPEGRDKQRATDWAFISATVGGIRFLGWICKTCYHHLPDVIKQENNKPGQGADQQKEAQKRDPQPRLRRI